MIKKLNFAQSKPKLVILHDILNKQIVRNGQTLNITIDDIGDDYINMLLSKKYTRQMIEKEFNTPTDKYGHLTNWTHKNDYLLAAYSNVTRRLVMKFIQEIGYRQRSYGIYDAMIVSDKAELLETINQMRNRLDELEKRFCS